LEASKPISHLSFSISHFPFLIFVKLYFVVVEQETLIQIAQAPMENEK